MSSAPDLDWQEPVSKRLRPALPPAPAPAPAPAPKPTPGPSGFNPLTHRPYSARYYALLEQRRRLPVFQHLGALRAAIESHQVVVVEGATGSGKTTQIPQYLVELGLGSPHGGPQAVACTQPRRVAATNIARRVAQEMDVRLGEEVGYTVRFDDCSDALRTRLRFLTDGMLLREAHSEPLLRRYACIVLDEAHERTLSTDVLMSVLKSVLRRRRDLRLVVMSATLNAMKFRRYFMSAQLGSDGKAEGEMLAPLVSVPGRTFPVELLYTPEPQRDYLEAAVKAVLMIHEQEAPGDVLLFLTGEAEINDAVARIQHGAELLDADTYGEVRVYPLYSSLPPQQQQLIFDPAPGPTRPGGPVGRKVVVSTNVAETSITIDGVVYVVDPGFVKQTMYDPRVRVQSLLVTPISQAAAKQRAGRAGRTQPGKAFRLYTEASFNNDLAKETSPEILRSRLESVVLTLLKIGIKDLVHFDFMDPPAPETLMRALECLNYLGAVNDDTNLTDLGNHLAALPVDPQLARALLASCTFDCTYEMACLVALLSVAPIYQRPHGREQEADLAHKEFIHPSGDHLTLLNAFLTFLREAPSDMYERRSWCQRLFLNPRSLETATSVKEQLENHLQYMGMRCEPQAPPDRNPQYYKNIQRALCSGMFLQTVFCGQHGVYKTAKDQQPVFLHPSTVLTTQDPWLVYADFLMTDKSYVRTLTRVEPVWLCQSAPHYFSLESWPAKESGRSLEATYRRMLQAGYD